MLMRTFKPPFTMEGIKNRKNPSTPLEDQAEFLDEQEQERLVSDLRKENEKSNRSIQRGLAGLSILVSSLYLLFLKELMYPAQALSVPMIPIPSREPITSETNYPGIAAAISLISLALSFYIILLNSGLSVLSLAKSVVSKDVEQGTPQSASLVVMGNTIVSLIPPLLSYGVSLKESVFWTLPLLVLLMDLLALQMMDNVNQELGGLESSKYKYKGA